MYIYIYVYMYMIHTWIYVCTTSLSPCINIYNIYIYVFIPTSMVISMLGTVKLIPSACTRCLVLSMHQVLGAWYVVELNNAF